MFFKIKAYLNFILKASNQHGVHSPFVYSLVTKCVYTKTSRETGQNLKKIKQKYSHNTSVKLDVLKRIHRIVSYFDFSEVLILSDHSAIITQTINLGKQRKASVDLNTNRK